MFLLRSLLRGLLPSLVAVLAIALPAGAVLSAGAVWAQEAPRSVTRPAAETARFPSVAGKIKPADYKAEAVLIVHYHRGDGRYEGWNLWSWAEGGPGAAHEFAGETPFGRYTVVPFTSVPKSAGLIVRRGDWVQKDIDRDRFVRFPEGGRVAEVWIASGDEKLYSDPSQVDLSLKLYHAFIDSPDTLTLATSAALPEALVAGLRVTHRDNPGRTLAIASAELVHDHTLTRTTYRLRLAEPVAPADIASWVLHVPGLDGAEDAKLTVYARGVLEGPEFTPLDAKLGYDTNASRTVFTTWSPVASRVELLLYGDAKAAGPQSKPVRTVLLERGDKGLWSAAVEGDLHGQAYRYRFQSYGKAREVPDVHTHGATFDSSFSVVLDLERLRPPEWGTVPQPKLARPTDEVIYEIHVRDFSIRDDSVPAAQRGTYLALAHENPARDSKPSTGLSHLRDLGVTAVHLLPIHDYTAEIGEYNWGYWTALFNVPEANYATDPKDPLLAPRELRAAIQGLHRAGVRVILDVVFNHTSSSGEKSPFDQTVPWYYFRTSADGKLLNDAGVGNSMADERPMVRKYIVDSTEFWVRQYRIDGFRFDLLGTHRPETARAVQDRLLPIRPDVTLYGEPWTGGGFTHFGKGAQRGTRMAVFNDHIRGAIRGDLDGTAPGFVTGTEGYGEAELRNGIAGSIDDFADHPIESINYASAHDNLTFWDKLLIARPEATDAERRAMQKLAHGIVLTSQGIPFIHGGCDFARTKGGNHNSYNAGDDVNHFDWARKAEYVNVFEYVRGLIAVRKAHPAFRLATAEEIRKHLHFLDTHTGGLVAYTLDGAGVGDAWTTILVAYNGAARPAGLTLPEGTWNVVVDDKTAGTATLRTASGRLELPPRSMVVLHKGK